MNIYFVAVAALVMAPSIIKALRGQKEATSDRPALEASIEIQKKPKRKRRKSKARPPFKPITLVTPNGDSIKFASNREAAQSVGVTEGMISHLRTGRRDNVRGWTLETDNKHYVRCAKQQLNGRYKHLRFDSVVQFGDYFQMDAKTRTKALKSGSYDGWDVMLSKKQK